MADIDDAFYRLTVAQRDSAFAENIRLRTNIASLLDNLRVSATPDAIGSDAWYVAMAISTLEKILAE